MHDCGYWLLLLKQLKRALSSTDPALLLGHLKLIKTLFTCEGVEKRPLGKKFLALIFSNGFLFSFDDIIFQLVNT